MSIASSLRTRSFHGGLWIAGALATLLAAGCSDGNGGSTGGSGGSTSTGGSSSGGSSGGSMSSGGSTGGTAGTTSTGDTTSTNTFPDCYGLVPGPYSVAMHFYETQSPSQLPQPGSMGTVSAAGSVTETGTGALPQDCPLVGVGITTGSWIRLTDAGGKSWTACYLQAGTTVPVQVGDAVAVQFQYDGGWNIPGLTALTLRKQDGALALFALSARSGTVDWPAEIGHADGDQVCHSDNAMGCVFDGYEMVATVAGEEAHIVPGQIGTAGGLEIHLGAWSHFSDSNECDFGYFDQQLVVTPAP